MNMRSTPTAEPPQQQRQQQPPCPQRSRRAAAAGAGALYCLGLLLASRVVAGAEQGLRRRAQAAAEEDRFYGKATDLEGQRRDPADEGSELAAAMGSAMLDAGFKIDWEAITTAEVEVPVGAEGADKSLLGRGINKMTSNSHWPFCAWDATTDANIYTPLLLDPNAVYQPQLLSFGERGTERIYRFKAKFPKAIYMSYQSYTLEGAPLTSIFDREIEPAWGLNPYRTPNATCDTAGGYEMYVTRDGKGGWPNELKGLPQVGEKGVSTTMRGTTSVLGDLSIVILRFYNTQPPPLIWGGVQPPEISYSDDFGKTWRVLEQCEDYERQRFNNILMRGGRAMHELQRLVRDNANFRELTCDMVARAECDVPAFFPSVNVQTTDSDVVGFIPFSNYDSDYAYWCTDGQQLGPDFVMVVTGEVPTVASGLYDPPLPVADAEAYEVRYWGLQSSDLNWPRPSYASISGRMMEEFYGPGWDRRYTVIAARNRDIARACGFSDEPGQAMFLPFSNTRANVTEPPVFPTIITREQLSRSLALGRPDRETDSIGYVVKNCDALGKCRDANFLRQQLGPKAPELQVYQCDVKTGKATPFIYKPTAVDMELRSRPQFREGNV